MRLLSTQSRLGFATCSLLLACTGWGQSSKIAFPQTDWSKVKPETVGYSSEKLEVLRAWLKTQKTTAMQVSVRGQVIFEYGDLKQVSKVAPVRKSVLTML